jgi:hypothetical protein
VAHRWNLLQQRLLLGHLLLLKQRHLLVLLRQPRLHRKPVPHQANRHKWQRLQPQWILA